MDCKILPSIKTEQPEVYPEYSDVHSSNKETLTEGHIVDKMDSEIPAEVKIEQAEVYLDYPEIHPSSESCPSIIKQEHSQMEMYHTPDLKLVKQELSDVLCEDKAHAFSKMVDWASGSIYQELARNSNTEPELTESDYKVLFNLENCSRISENVSPMIEINKNPPLTNENFQLHNMETGVNQTQISRGSLDFTVDSASGICSKIQTPYMLDGCNLSVNAEKETPKVEKPYKQQDCGVAVTETDHVNEENCHSCDDGITYFLQDVQGNKRTHTGLRPFKCDLTGSSFAYADHLKCLKRTHTGEKPYTCDSCGTSLATVEHLNSHQKTHTGEKPCKHDVCKESCSQNHDPKSRKRKRTRERPYECDVCGISFPKVGNLNSHKRTTHKEEKLYKCNVCSISFAQVGALTTHKRKHSIADLKLVKQDLSDVLCEDKGHTFSKMVDWASGSISEELAGNSNTGQTESDYKVLFNLENGSHISENVSLMIEINKNLPLTSENFQLHNIETGVNHTQISRGSLDFTVDSASNVCSKIQTPFMMDGCDLSVNAEKEILKVEKPYKQQDCDVAVTETDHVNEENCDDGIASFLQDVQGSEKAHTGLRPFKCDLTSSSFAHADHLRRGLKRTHTGEKPYKCDICSISFSTVDHLNSHKRKHTKEKSYKCDVCEASFSQIYQLKSHKRTHKEKKQYLCDVCGVYFAHASGLNNHKRKHTGEKPYKCEICGISFAQAGSLKRHRTTHTVEKPYKCDICDASFAQTDDLKYHKITHTGGKPYKFEVRYI